MAAPKVFVSSTWYDLRYIRENLKYFISNLRYEPVLSEEGFARMGLANYADNNISQQDYRRLRYVAWQSASSVG
jgi:hypothetical protein